MRPSLLSLLAIISLTGLISVPAFGQDLSSLPPVPEEDESSPDSPPPGTGTGAPDSAPAPLVRNQAPPPTAPQAPEPPPAQPKRTYELSLRSRYVSVPRGLLDLFLVNGGDAEWPLPGESRPDVLGYSIGMELGVMQKEGTLLGFYVEYLGSLMREGYWTDRDDPPDGRDGRYLKPSPGFGAVVVAFNAFHDTPIVDDGQTQDRFALSFYVGGGIGIAGIVGHIDQWRLNTTDGTPAYVSYRAGDPPEGRVNLGSPIWPMIDFELGFRMVFAQHLVLRLGGGLHNGLQLGGNLGARF